MVLTAHQPCYMPWLGLFDKISQADVFVFYDDVPIEHYGYTNRNKVKSANGPVWLTVPFHGTGKPINQVEIHDGRPWRRKHWRTLQQSYSQAPYWDRYAPNLKWLYEQEWKLLVDLIYESMFWLLRDVLCLQTPCYRASELGLTGTKSVRALDMCEKLGADTLVFGSQGRAYADLEAFDRAGVNVVFQSYDHPVYPQLHGDFQGFLSIIDLIMNVGPESLEVLRGHSGVLQVAGSSA